MAITQKFYPKFFEKALKGTNGTTFSGNPSTINCKIGLYDNSAIFNSALETTGSLGGLVEGSVQDVVLTMSQEGTSLNFGMNAVTWNSGGPFTNAIVSTDSGQAIMHLEFETNMTPQGQFSIVMATSSSINLAPSP